MKKGSAFTQIILVFAVALIGLVLTVMLALLAGSIDTTLFDWRNLNFSNMIPVFIVGGFLTCISVCIAVVIVSRSLFGKVRDYLFENKDQTNKGDNDL